MSILVIEHEEGEHAGRLGTTLRDLNHHLDIRQVWHGHSRPAGLDEFEAVISLGGPMNAWQAIDYVWMREEINLLREAHEQKMPIVGICLGCQLLAVALGGEVGPMEKNSETNPSGLEIGWHEIKMAFPGTVEALFAGLPWKQMQFHWHGAEVKKLPAGAAPLAGSKLCRTQAFHAGVRSYGFQYHFEVTRSQIEYWSRKGKEQPAAAGIQHVHLALETNQYYADYSRLGDRLCNAIANYLIPAVPLAY